MQKPPYVISVFPIIYCITSSARAQGKDCRGKGDVDNPPGSFLATLPFNTSLRCFGRSRASCAYHPQGGQDCAAARAICGHDAALVDTSSPPSAELLLKEKPLYICTQSLPPVDGTQIKSPPCVKEGGSRSETGGLSMRYAHGHDNPPVGLQPTTPLHKGASVHAHPKPSPCGWYAYEARDLPQQRSEGKCVRRSVSEGG
jgi:hypothetical protein